MPRQQVACLVCVLVSRPPAALGLVDCPNLPKLCPNPASCFKLMPCWWPVGLHLEAPLSAPRKCLQRRNASQCAICAIGKSSQASHVSITLFPAIMEVKMAFWPSKSKTFQSSSMIGGVPFAVAGAKHSVSLPELRGKRP